MQLFLNSWSCFYWVRADLKVENESVFPASANKFNSIPDTWVNKKLKWNFSHRSALKNTHFLCTICVLDSKITGAP